MIELQADKKIINEEKTIKLIREALKSDFLTLVPRKNRLAKAIKSNNIEKKFLL